MWRLALLALLPTAAWPDSLVATRTIRAQSVIGPDDVALVAADIPGAISDAEAALGLEARVSLYAGRPIRPKDVGPPAIVERNQIVPMRYAAGSLTILTDGRALVRGRAGDVIRVMNLASRTTVTGQIADDGTVQVGPNQ